MLEKSKLYISYFTGGPIGPELHFPQSNAGLDQSDSSLSSGHSVLGTLNPALELMVVS